MKRLLVTLTVSILSLIPFALVSAYDLSVRKEVAGEKDSYTPGDTVTFLITVKNEGDVGVGGITVYDYFSKGLELVDTLWGLQTPLVASPEVISYLEPGEEMLLPIEFKVVDDFPFSRITNHAEVGEVWFVDGESGNDEDRDSTPGNGDGVTSHIEGSRNPESEDDYASVSISVEREKDCFPIDTFLDTGKNENDFLTIKSGRTPIAPKNLSGVIGGSRLVIVDGGERPGGGSVAIAGHHASSAPGTLFVNTNARRWLKVTLRYASPGEPFNLNGVENIVIDEVGNGDGRPFSIRITLRDNQGNLAESHRTFSDRIGGGREIFPLGDFSGIEKVNLSQVEEIEIHLDNENEADFSIQSIYACGFRRMEVGSLVWEDSNRNGIQDPGEEGVEGVSVFLSDENGKAIPGIRSVKTDHNGRYLISGIPEGVYRVGIILPKGYQLGPKQNPGDVRDETDSNADGEFSREFQKKRIAYSGTFSLERGKEPRETGTYRGDDADDGNEKNGNMTVDFGLVVSESNSGGGIEGEIGGGGINGTYVCRDRGAINYKPFGKHDPSLCKYEKEGDDEPPKTESSPQKKRSSDQGGSRAESGYEQSKPQRRSAEENLLCQRYLSQEISPAFAPKDEVIRLQKFLNEFEGYSLEVNGKYDSATRSAVRAYQEKYARDILYPWRLSHPSDTVLSTMRGHINARYRESSHCKKEDRCENPFTKYLSVGTVDPEVSRVKQFLRDLGFYHGPINTVFGEDLRRAVRDFQNENYVQVLKPWGIPCKCGTGYWYQTTRAFANELIGCPEPAPKLNHRGPIQCVLEHFPEQFRRP